MIFLNNEIVLYKNINDLSDKINFYKKNDRLRKKLLKMARKKYFKLFNEKKLLNILLIYLR